MYRAVRRNIARRPLADPMLLGPMFYNGSIAAHEECLLYAAGSDLIQVANSEPA